MKMGGLEKRIMLLAASYKKLLSSKVITIYGHLKNL